MSSPSQPTLIYPNGNEIISAKYIIIEWKESIPVSDGSVSWYEIYYTDNYDYLEEPDWKMIAIVPSGITKFEWKIGNLIKSKQCRVAIRSVNNKGEKSDYSISAYNFSIQRSLPYTPSIISPVNGGEYSDSIKIIFDEKAVYNNASRRSKYYIYFRSSKLGIPLSPIAQRIPIGTGPIVWDIHLLEPSDDYIITVYAADDDGNRSSEVNISDIKIINQGFFLIDTIPPDTYVQINSGNQFTKSRDVSVRLFAYDETTSPHALQFIEGDNIGEPESIQEIRFWKLSEEDGTKIINVKYQDFGGNRSSVKDQIFRTFFDLNNQSISDIVMQKLEGEYILWIAVNGEYPSIYKSDPNTSLVSRVNEKINSISIYKDLLYVAVQTSDSTGLLYKISNNNKITESLSITDEQSEINSIQEYKSYLYIGSSNGSLYVYDGKTSSLIRDFDQPIKTLFSDASLLYITFYHSNYFFIYDGYNFTEVSL